ncbi:MAG: sugar kinase [Rhodobacteraceae bacterium]|nr:sugar kinase [Paracoccaceae bacterium]
MGRPPRQKFRIGLHGKKNHRSGPKTEFFNTIGTDPMSDRIADFIRAEGIRDDLVIRSAAHMPGLYAISTDAAGERSFAYWRDSSAARSLFQPRIGPEFDQLATFDALCLSAITLAILPPDIRTTLLDWLSGYRANGGLVIFDSNFRPRLWEDAATAREVIQRAWAITDIGLPSVDDEMAIFGDADPDAVHARLNSYGLKLGALKRGEEGPLSLGGQQYDQIYPPAETIVDTTAAGDSFNGGYLAAWASGASEAEVLLAGHMCARKVVGLRGAFG